MSWFIFVNTIPLEVPFDIWQRAIVYNRFHVNYLDIRTLMQGQFFAKEEEAFKVYKDKWFNPQLSLAC